MHRRCTSGTFRRRVTDEPAGGVGALPCCVHESLRLRRRLTCFFPDEPPTPAFVTTVGVRFAIVVVLAALVLAPAASANGWHPSPSWLVQAACIHRLEGPWSANTGNGYFGGMQFSAATWKRVGGPPNPAFAHPGDSAYPFVASPHEQLYRAWLVWLRDGRSWLSWGGVGTACSQ